MRRGGWFWPLNLALLSTAVLMFATQMTVLFFHVMFILLTLATLFWEFHAFTLGAAFWVAVTGTGVIGAVYAGRTQPEEIVEVPLLTAILVVAFLIARRRARAQAQVAALLATEQERARRLRELATLKADFSAMVAHELVSPLTALRVRAEMLGRRDFDLSGRQKIVDAMTEDINALADLVTDIHTAARVERDDFVLRPRPVALEDLLGAAARFVDTLPGGHPFVVEAEADGWVWADAERMGQVLRNLLSNAARYSPAGAPVRLRVTRTARPPGRERFRIEVIDEGPGVHPDDLPRVFEKFGRGRDGRGNKAAGAGLGLYISERIVGAHGSKLTARSALGESSVFAFELDATRESP